MQKFIIRIDYRPAPNMIKIDIGATKEVKSNKIWVRFHIKHFGQVKTR